MKTTRFFALIMATLFLASCAPKLTPFTENLRKQNNWSDDQIQKIQFYLSDDIMIRRQLKESSSEIISGEIKMVDGRQVEEVLIPKGTPGVMEYRKDGSAEIAISFESGRHLMFGPNPKMQDRYALMAKAWKNKVGKVTYDGKQFYTQPGDGYSYLMVNLKKINNVDVKSRTVKGVKVN